MLVSNTSTLVLLAKTGCLEQFIEISPKIKIPVQVRREALFDKESYYAKLIEKFIKEGKIKVVETEGVDDIMQEFRLDAGEAAAYVLFKSGNYDAILTDDGELIKLCKLQNIDFITAMAVVIRLYEKNKLSKKKSLEKLKDLHEIGRYSNYLYEHFRSEVK